MKLRDPETQKGDYGRALLVAGSHGCVGCAILAARAALRSGCGTLTVHLPSKCVDPVQAAVPEAMVSIDQHKARFGSLPDGIAKYDAVAVGPGIGTSDASQSAFAALLQIVPPQHRLILDADALNILAQHPELFEYIDGRAVPTIITPHSGEYIRLFGEEDPADMAREHNIVIVKKSHNTHVYAPDGLLYVNHTGNAGMATAGSGDVLTGIILGISAQKAVSAFEAACIGVRVHGAAGDKAAEGQTQDSMIASDLVENLKWIDIE